jgi:hypothetical protein
MNVAIWLAMLHKTELGKEVQKNLTSFGNMYQLIHIKDSGIPTFLTKRVGLHIGIFKKRCIQI